MMKTYIRVHWGYLEFMIRKFGFHVKLISIIMSCVKIDVDFYFGQWRSFPLVLPISRVEIRRPHPLSYSLFAWRTSQDWLIISTRRKYGEELIFDTHIWSLLT